MGDRVVPAAGEEYERLGGKKLSLIDVLAQSVGFMGPVFSAAFIIPLIIGVNVAARGAGTSAPLAVLIAGISGWVAWEEWQLRRGRSDAAATAPA